MSQKKLSCIKKRKKQERTIARSCLALRLGYVVLLLDSEFHSLG